MIALRSDNLARKHARDFERLKRGWLRSPLKLLLLVCLVGAIVASAIMYLSGHGASREAGRKELLLSRNQWSRELVLKQEAYSSWLANHGSAREVSFFESVSSLIFGAASSIGGRDKKVQVELSYLSRIYIWLAFAALQVAFLVISCWRLWLFAAVVAALWGFFSWRVHKGRDLLGETGTGKIFYSGIYAGLGETSNNGVLTKHVTGLACPAAVPAKVAQSSALGTLLTNYNALNSTTVHLAAVLLAHPDCPTYVAQREEEKLLDESYAGSKLADHAIVLLETVLEVHAGYCGGNFAGTPARVTENGRSEALDSAEYGELLKVALHRAVTPRMRERLSEIPAAQVAVAVLAFEAGKVLGYSFEGGKWWKKTQYPQLSARAVLHSIPSYADDYDVEARDTVRRALIYAARSSAFGPVRLAVDLSESSEALRQWIELLLAYPHELQAVADEVELFGRIREAHRSWSEKFFSAVVALAPEAVEHVFATPFNSFFMPLTNVLSLLRSAISKEETARIDELVFLVSQRQRLEIMAMESGPSAEQERTPLPAYEKISPPISLEEQKRLAELHGMTMNDVRDWSALRTVLNLNGWLAKRIGDFTVPDSSLAFAVFELPDGSAGVNEHNLIGQNAMVPLRATRLDEKWGKAWQGKFALALSATIAETKEDFARLLRGERLADEEVTEDFSTALA